MIETQTEIKLTTQQLKARERLAQIIKEQNVPIAHTAEDLYRHSVKDDDGEEVNDFLRMLEEWRREGHAERRNFEQL